MHLLFDKIIGTGGIGSGMLFYLDNDQPIGRNESRLAVLSGARDYCKQHIILHYIAKTLSPAAQVLAIGAVGQDSNGQQLLREMAAAGIDTRFVRQDADNPTMLSMCVQYADKSGFNVTTSNSASGALTAEYAEDCLHGLEISRRTLVLSAPEVPLEARFALMRCAKAHGAFCAASVLKDEADEFAAAGGFALCDLLAVNEDEAQAIAGTTTADIAQIASDCFSRVARHNPDVMLVVTAGKLGSYSVFHGNIENIPALPAEPVSTAGAGDAYLAGVICGLSLGLPLQNEGAAEKLRATDAGSFLAHLSILSPHTIADTVTGDEVRRFVQGR